MTYIELLLTFKEKNGNRDFFSHIENVLWDRITSDPRKTAMEKMADKNELYKALDTLEAIANKYADK